MIYRNFGKFLVSGSFCLPIFGKICDFCFKNQNFSESAGHPIFLRQYIKKDIPETSKCRFGNAR